MHFVAPDIKYKEKAKEYIQEFIDARLSINGTGELDAFLIEKNYEEWLEEIEKNSDTSVKIPGRVNDATFFYVREEDDRIVGMANIRYGLNAFLFREGGHIGYSVRPSEQGKGIATELLQDALRFCRFIGLSKVLVVCDKNNPASARVIEKCGGVLEDEVVSEVDGEIVRRYWIDNEGGIFD